METHTFDFYARRQHNEDVGFAGADWADCFEQAMSFAQSMREQWGAECVEIRDASDHATLTFVYTDSVPY